MSLAKSGARQIIAQFGVYVKVFPQDGQEVDDTENPVFFNDTENTEEFEEHKVRLYTTASEEMMQDYGLDESADSLMYCTDDIADQGDRVVYEKGGQKWNVEERMTNQISANGPYIFVYSMGAI